VDVAAAMDEEWRGLEQAGCGHKSDAPAGMRVKGRILKRFLPRGRLPAVGSRCPVHGLDCRRRSADLTTCGLDLN
jgi:hypothetical protein